jgi:hypothetical protein
MTVDVTNFVSLLQILHSPKLFDGKRVRVIGFASFSFEGKAIYVSEEAYRHAVTKNGLWLSCDLNDETKKLHETYVLVEGILDAKSLGHLKMYSGTVREIDRLEPWSDPDATVRPDGGPSASPAPSGSSGDGGIPEVPMPGRRTRS